MGERTGASPRIRTSPSVSTCRGSVSTMRSPQAQALTCAVAPFSPLDVHRSKVTGTLRACGRLDQPFPAHRDEPCLDQSAECLRARPSLQSVAMVEQADPVVFYEAPGRLLRAVAPSTPRHVNRTKVKGALKACGRLDQPFYPHRDEPCLDQAERLRARPFLRCERHI